MFRRGELEKIKIKEKRLGFEVEITAEGEKRISYLTLSSFGQLQNELLRNFGTRKSQRLFFLQT